MKYLECKNVSFSYKKNSLAISGVSIDVFAGDRVALLGKIGSGKTTFLRVLCGLLKPQTGSFQYMVPRAKIAYLPASQGLTDGLTVGQNVNLWKRAYGLDVSEVFEIENQFNLNRIRDKKISELSSGLRQVTAYVCTCIGEHKVLLLDEPFVNLDFDSCSLVCDYIMNLDKNEAVVISSHNLEYVEKICNRFIFIRDGEIAYLADGEEVVNYDSLVELYKQYVNGGAV